MRTISAFSLAMIASGVPPGANNPNQFSTENPGNPDSAIAGSSGNKLVRLVSATAIARDLALDAGYLSRILRRLESRGCLAREPSPVDARQRLLQLTTSGQEGVAP